MSRSEVLARIDILRLKGGDVPGVKLTALEEFMDMPPVQKAVMISAVMQLCSAIIEAIMEDSPDDADEIREVLTCLSIEREEEASIN